MVRHRWELRDDVAAPLAPGRRLRLRLGRGATLIILLGAVAWIASSLFFHPAAGGGALLGEVRLEPDRAARQGSSAPPEASIPTAGSPPRHPATIDPSQPGEPSGRVPEPAPPGGGVPPVPAEPGDGSSEHASGSSDPAARTLLVVHVAGAVRKPGVYEFAPGTRAGTAVAAAGGLTAEADAAAVNLAAPVADGTQLLIPVRGQVPPAPAPGPSGVPGAPGGAPGAPAGGVPGAPVNVNTATTAELEELPGIGPALAGSIIDFRQRNGPFASMAELDAVPGIGPAMMDKLEGLVALP